MLNLRGSVLVATHQTPEAAACFARAAEIAPDRADIAHNLALVLNELGHFDEALKTAERAFLLDPAEPDYRASLVRRLLCAGKVEAAVAAGKAAVAVAPRHIDCHEAYAIGLLMDHQTDPAIALLVSLVRQTQSAPDACLALARVLRQAGRLDEALTSIEHVRRTVPDHVAAAVLEADLKLALGQYPPPVDNGAAEATDRAVYSTHGVPLGDAIFLSRWLRSGMTLICEVGQAAVLSGIEGVTTVVAPASDTPSIRDLLPAADLAQEADNPRRAYMKFAPALVEPWTRALASLPAPRIGILWNDSAFDVPFDQLAGALEGFGTLVSLATGEARRHQQKWPEIMDGGAHIHAAIDHAAAIAALDMIVTTVANAAHLAGALGKPGFVIAGSGRPWQWRALDGRSIWYPSLQVVTQPCPGNWDEAMQDLRDRLRQSLEALQQPQEAQA